MEMFGDLPVLKFVLVFAFVLTLIGVAAWLVRRFGAARLAAGRGRQPRLAVIDAAAVDGRRKLIIIRRDNVEHLLMIGGPSDVVVETNILRAGAANQREAATPRADSLPRAPALPEAPTWPLQPEPTLAPRAERARMSPEEPFAASPPSIPVPPPPTPVRAETPARQQIPNDPLMGLAAELSRSKHDSTVRPPEPPRTSFAPSYQNGETPIVPAAPTAPPAPDAHLAEMAHRLETALRRPLSQSPQAPKSDAPQRPLTVTEPRHADSRPSPSNGAPTNGTAGNGAQGKTVYESLEQEMASLLGRQTGKS